MTAEERATEAWRNFKLDEGWMQDRFMRAVTDAIKTTEREALEKAASSIEGPCQECANAIRELKPE